ncbi:MAG TPA: phenylalanine--tRNA ligase beta subunit-related protein [Nitrolancea sp.]
MQFGYAPELLERCPELVAGVIWIEGVRNRRTTPEIDEILTESERLTHKRFAALPEIARSESIGAWRQIYSRFGVKPNRYPCAAEALIRRVVETGSLPRISALVDLCTATSLRHSIPVAPFDLANVTGDISVRIATGSERFLPIGATTYDVIPEGEVVYADASPELLSRRWNWRQSDKGKIELTTTRALLTTEAVHAGGRAPVLAVLQDISEQIVGLLGGTAQTAILDAGNPATERLVQ